MLYEVITDAVERLNGIFAFAIWDSVREHILFARDRLGVKPLFYSEAGETLVFGSEPKALLQHPKVEALVGPRITSYNVCYTKLLRRGSADDHSRGTSRLYHCI